VSSPLSPDRAAPAGNEPPAPAELTHLKPTNLLGACHLAFGVALTLLALGLCFSETWLAWAAGQLLLAVAGLFWFAALHEAGHRTLFRGRLLNGLAGHLAGFLALIPFDCWKPVHARHHQWAGWQDLDLTTATLVPRRLSLLEVAVLNLCWWLWVPLFATLYRLNNYWHLPRLYRHFAEPWRRRRLALGILLCLGGYVALLAWVGPWSLLGSLGPGIYLTLAMQDLLILSQHTHIPMRQSEGQPVQPFTPRQQEAFTRSLVFPRWFARLVLLNVDAHELHHLYPQVPGYLLDAIPYRTGHAVPWWRWVWHAKTTRADVLLFQNWDQTGYRV
jgi:fatty acid desaturase